MEERQILEYGRSAFVKTLLKKTQETMNEKDLNEETIRDVERMMVLRVSTKHINLWARQLELKRKEIGELAGLMGFCKVKNEVETEKSLEKWAKRCTNHFTRREKRMLFGEIDNIVWSGKEKEIVEWCKENSLRRNHGR